MGLSLRRCRIALGRTRLSDAPALNPQQLDFHGMLAVMRSASQQQWMLQQLAIGTAMLIAIVHG
jgi:hypothetical protein